VSEQSPQPQQDILTEAQGYPSFDNWLSTIPDERLKQVANVIGGVSEEHIEDEESFTHLLGVAMHFSGNIAMPIEEIAKAYSVLAMQVGFEVNVRNGIVTKDGEYSMHPDGKNARFTVTDKGQQIYGSGGDA